MKAWLVAGAVAVLALVATPSTSQAQFQGPFSCGTFCVCHFGKMHQHGPLYNYGPYYGYPPYTNNCSSGNCGGSNWGNWFHKNSCNTCGSSWGKYSLSTLKNVFHRTHPCGNKVGCTGCNTCN